MSTLLDLTDQETLDALIVWHQEQSVLNQVAATPAWAGLGYYLIAPLLAGAFPIAYEYLVIKTVEDATATGWWDSYDPVSLYYKYAWLSIVWGNVGLNGLLWVFELIATFGGIPRVNYWMWTIFYDVLGVAHFGTNLAFYLLALFKAFEANDNTMKDAIIADVTIYVAAFAFERAMYAQMQDSWRSGMLLCEKRRINKGRKVVEEGLIVEEEEN